MVLFYLLMKHSVSILSSFIAFTRAQNVSASLLMLSLQLRSQQTLISSLFFTSLPSIVCHVSSVSLGTAGARPGRTSLQPPRTQGCITSISLRAAVHDRKRILCCCYFSFCFKLQENFTRKTSSIEITFSIPSIGAAPTRNIYHVFFLLRCQIINSHLMYHSLRTEENDKFNFSQLLENVGGPQLLS